MKDDHVYVCISVGSDMTEEAIENIVRAQWQKVDDLIDKYKKKCDQAKVNNGMIIHSNDFAVSDWFQSPR